MGCDLLLLLLLVVVVVVVIIRVLQQLSQLRERWADWEERADETATLTPRRVCHQLKNFGRVTHGYNHLLFT